MRSFLQRLQGRARRSERGATLTEYSLIVAVFLTVSLAGIETLNNNSEEFLGQTGSQVGAPRQYADQAAAAPLAPPPAWALPTTPPTLRTYTNANLVIGGNCIGWDAANSVFSTVACGTSEIAISATSGNGTDIELSFSGGCFGASPGATPEVFATACGSSPWTQVDSALPDVRYEYNGTGQCISFVTPANPGDSALELAPCATPGTRITII